MSASITCASTCLPDARIHYAMIDAGGVAPNVVQATGHGALCGARARDLPGMHALIDRVKKVAARRRPDDRDERRALRS